MRKTTTALLIVTSLALGVIGLGVAGFLWIQSDRGEAFIESEVEKAVRAAIEDGGFSLGDVDLRGDRLTVSDIRLDGQDTEGIVRVGSVTASVDKSRLLRRTLALEDVKLADVDLSLPRRADGSLDLPLFVSEPSASTETTWMPGGWVLDIDAVALEDIDIHLPDDDMLVTGLSGQFDVDATADTFELGAIALSARAERPDLGPVEATGRIAFTGGSLSHSALDLDIDQTTLDLDAASEGLLDRDDPTIDMTLDGTVERKLIRSLLSWTDNDSALEMLRDGPAFGVDLEMDGVLSALEISRARLSQLDRVFLGAQGTITLGEDTVVDLDLASDAPAALFRELDVPAGATSVHAPLKVVLPPSGPVTIDGRFEARGVQLNEGVVRAPVLQGAFAGPVTEALRIDLGLDAPTLVVDAGQTLHTAVDATIQVTSEAVSGHTTLRPFTPTPTQIDTDLTYATTGHLRFANLSIAVEGAPYAQSQGPITTWVVDGGLTDLDGRIVASGGGEITFELDRVASEVQRGWVRIDALEVEPVAELASALTTDVPGIRGVLDLNATFDAGPAGRTLTADTALRGLVVEEQLARTDLTGTLVMEGTELDGTLEALRDEEPWLTTRVISSLPADAWAPSCGDTVDARASLTEIRVSELADRIVALEDPGVDAQLSGSIEASGAACDPDVALDAWVAARWNGEPVRFEASLRDGSEHQTVLTGSADVGDLRAASVEGRLSHPRPVEWAKAEDPVAALDAWRLDLRIHDAPTGLITEQIGGHFVGGATLAGTGSTPEQITAAIAIADPTLQEQPLDRVEIGVQTRRGRLESQAIFEAPGHVGLHAFASTDLADVLENTTDASFTAEVPPSEVPVALLAGFFPGVVDDPAGMFELEATGSGTLGNPQLDGRLAVVDGAAVVRETGVRYYDTQFEIDLADRVAVIETATVRSRPRYGRFARQKSDIDLSVDGQIDFTGGEPELALQAELDGFWALANNIGVAELAGALEVSGVASAPRVTGDLRVTDASFDIERYLFIPPAGSKLHPDIRFVDGRPDTLTVDTPDAPSVADLMSVDLDVDVGRSARLRATVPMAPDAGLVGSIGDAKLDATVDGDLDVELEDGETAVYGALDTQGRATLLSAQFDIVDGELSFGGRSYTSPILDFTLRRENTDYGAVTARVRGTPSDVRIDQLASDSGMSRADIMAQLMFGRPLSDLSEGGEGVSGAALVQQALVSVAGGQLERAIGLEVVDSIDFSANSGLSVGWAIGEDAFLTVQLDPTAREDENTTAVNLNWYLGPVAEAEISTGDAADSSAWLLVEESF